MALNEKQERFVAHYVKSLNATSAAISAGYSKRTAHSQGPRLLEHDEVKARIAEKSAKVMTKLDISPERILNELAKLAFFDPVNLFNEDGSIKPLSEIDANTRSVIAGIEVSDIYDSATGEQKSIIGTLKKIKVSDRLAALDKLMRYHALYVDKIEHTGTVGVQLIHSIPRPDRDK